MFSAAGPAGVSQVPPLKERGRVGVGGQEIKRKKKGKKGKSRMRGEDGESEGLRVNINDRGMGGGGGAGSRPTGREEGGEGADVNEVTRLLISHE